MALQPTDPKCHLPSSHTDQLKPTSKLGLTNTNSGPRCDGYIVNLGLRVAWQATAPRSIHNSYNFLSTARGSDPEELVINQGQNALPNRPWEDEKESQVTRIVPTMAYKDNFVFHYPPLTITPASKSTVSRQMIRLLELLPGQGSDSIACNLRPASLLDRPAYEAISYSWGDLNDRISIFCNDRLLPVSRTLVEALHGLRYRDKVRVLWADAICINQSDIAERNRQVQLMRTIYSQALGTLIWLGTPDRVGEHAISFLTRLAINVGLEVLKPRGGCLSSSLVHFRNSQTMECSVRSPFSTDFYIELIKMLRNPWFRRAWVVQEVAVSRKAIVVWGVEQCEW